MTTTRLAIRGVAFNGVARVASIGISFFLTPFLVRTLGREAYGVWSIVMSLTTYYGLADLGLRGAGTKYIAQHHAINDDRAVNRVLVTSLLVYAILAVVPLLLAMGVAWGFERYFGPTNESPEVIRSVVILTGAMVSVQLLGQAFGAVLPALLRFDLMNVMVIVTQLTQAAAMVAVLRAGYGLLGMGCVVLLVAVLTQAVQVILTFWLLPTFSLSARHFDRQLLPPLFHFGILNTFVALAQGLIDYAGGLIIGVLLGLAATAGFAIAENLNRHGRAMSKTVGFVVMPLASRLESQRRHDQLIRVLVSGPRVLFALGLSLAVVFVVQGESIIRLWISSDFVPTTYPALQVLSWAMVVSVGTQSLTSMLVGMGKMRFMTIISTLQGALVLALGWWFVSMSGVVGMAYATLAAYLLTSVLVIPWYTCRLLGFPVWKWFPSVIVPGLIAAIPGTALALAFEHYAPPHRLMDQLLPQIMLVCAVHAVSAFFICLPAATRWDVIGSLQPRKPAVSSPDETISSPSETLS